MYASVTMIGGATCNSAFEASAQLYDIYGCKPSEIESYDLNFKSQCACLETKEF